MNNQNVELSIAQQTPNSLIKETIFPQSPQVLRQAMAQPIIGIRNGIVSMANDRDTGIGVPEVKEFEAGLPEIYRATESFMFRELGAIKSMQSDPQFDQATYTNQVISEIAPLLSTDPEEKQRQIDAATATISSLFAEIAILPDETFQISERSDTDKADLSYAPILQPVLATGIKDIKQNSGVTLMSMNSQPGPGTNQGGANNVFDDFQRFLSSRTGGVSLGILAFAVTAINIGTTGAGLGNWDFTAAEGGIRWGKLAVDMGLATIWNFGQTAALAFTVEYLRRGSLGKLGATLKNIKDESFGTYLNTALGIGLGVLSYNLLKGDINFTAQALNRLGDVDVEFGIPLAILIEVGSQFFTAYGTPISAGLRRMISAISPALSGLGRRAPSSSVSRAHQPSNPNTSTDPIISRLNGLIRQLPQNEQGVFRSKAHGSLGNPQELQKIISEIQARLGNP